MTTKPIDVPRVSVVLKPERIRDLIETARKHGSTGYWARWPSDRVVQEVEFSDASRDPVVVSTHRITNAAIRRGLEAMAIICPRHFAAIVTGDYDARTADVLIQLICFGGLVYG